MIIHDYFSSKYSESLSVVQILGHYLYVCVKITHVKNTPYSKSAFQKVSYCTNIGIHYESRCEFNTFIMYVVNAWLSCERRENQETRNRDCRSTVPALCNTTLRLNPSHTEQIQQQSSVDLRVSSSLWCSKALADHEYFQATERNTTFPVLGYHLPGESF